MEKKHKMPSKLLRESELFVVSAPSGAGKTTLCRELSAIVPYLRHSVSYTTRAPRKGERNNVHYTFISEKKFKTMINKGEFAEWAVVHGNLYGTSIKRLREMDKKGCDIILDIDTQGAKQLKRIFNDAVYIFILPPSMKILKERLRTRMSESPLEIKRRLEKAKEEIIHYKDYDYVVINDDFKKAVKELESIIVTRRLKTDKVSLAWVEKLKSDYID